MSTQWDSPASQPQTPPGPVIDCATHRLENWEAIQSWARYNNPTWLASELRSTKCGLSEIGRLRALAADLLCDNHKLTQELIRWAQTGVPRAGV